MHQGACSLTPPAFKCTHIIRSANPSPPPFVYDTINTFILSLLYHTTISLPVYACPFTALFTTLCSKYAGTMWWKIIKCWGWAEQATLFVYFYIINRVTADATSYVTCHAKKGTIWPNRQFNGSNLCLSHIDFICKLLLAYDNFKWPQYKLYILHTLPSQLNALCMNNSGTLDKI